jgi:hypothetical protein
MQGAFFISFLVKFVNNHSSDSNREYSEKLFNTLLDVLRAQQNILRYRNSEGFRDWILWFYVFSCFAYNFIKPQG